MMQRRAIITVSCEVQGVGYRDIVSKIARKMKITGFVENIRPYDVRIVCEGTEENIYSFLEKLNIKKFPVDVEEIKFDFSEPSGEFEIFEVKRGDIADELGERLDVARLEMTKMLEKQDRMLDLQKETINTIKIEGEKTRYIISTHVSNDLADVRQEIIHMKYILSRVMGKIGISEY